MRTTVDSSHKPLRIALVEAASASLTDAGYLGGSQRGERSPTADHPLHLRHHVRIDDDIDGGGNDACCRLRHDAEPAAQPSDERDDAPLPPLTIIQPDSDDDGGGASDAESNRTQSDGASTGSVFGSPLTPHGGCQRAGLTAIVDGVLYLGSARDASDADACRRLGIRAYLCVAGNLPRPTPCHALPPQFPPPRPAAADEPDQPPAPPVATLHLGMRDAMDVSLADFAPAACAFIDAQAAAGKPVALYCQAGRSRSVAIAAAYVMHRTGLDGAAALRYVAQRYARADPNIGFVGQLVTPIDGSIAPRHDC